MDQSATGTATPGDPPLPAYPGTPVTSSSQTLAAVATTPKPCDDNGADKALTRAEVLTRAQSWLSVVVPYSQERCYRNQYGDYRTDCSGFVSMAWGLGGSGSDFWTGNLLNRSYVIPRSDLRPGDALLRYTGDPDENHVALFVRWLDAAHTRPNVYEQTGIRDTVESDWSADYASLYTPIRYDHIIESEAEAPHGPMYDRTRSASGSWASSSVLIENNNAITRTAAVALPNGTLHGFNLIPGSGTWTRARSAAGVWAANATHVDTNGSVTDIAAASLPDGTLHLFVLVPGSGTWTRARSAAGVWAANATHVDTNGSVTDIAATGLPDGTMQLSVLVPGSGTWTRARSASGVWAANAVHADTNGSVTDIAAAALPDGTMHLFVLVPGSGTWARARSAAGVWAANATHVDTNGSVIAVSAAGLGDGTLHLTVTVPNAGVWHRYRTLSGSWATNRQIDTNGRIFHTYTAALPDRTMHVGVLVNTA